IDGNNIIGVYDTMRGVRDYCIKNQRPYLVECMTFRMRGHEEASGVKYVPKELIEEWGKKDPLKNYEEFLKKEDLLNDGNISSMHSLLKKEIEESLAPVFDEPEIVADTTEEMNDV